MCGPHGLPAPRLALLMRGSYATRGPRGLPPMRGPRGLPPPAPAAPQLASWPPFPCDMRPWASPVAPPWRGRETNVSRETYPHRVSPPLFPARAAPPGVHLPARASRLAQIPRLAQAPPPPAARVACPWVALRFFGLRCKFSRFCTRPSRLSTLFSCGQQGKGQVANASQAFAEAQPLCGECKTVRICSAAAFFSRFCPVLAASHAG